METSSEQHLVVSLVIAIVNHYNHYIQKVQPTVMY